MLQIAVITHMSEARLTSKVCLYSQVSNTSCCKETFLPTSQEHIMLQGTVTTPVRMLEWAVFAQKSGAFLSTPASTKTPTVKQGIAD